METSLSELSASDEDTKGLEVHEPPRSTVSATNATDVNGASLNVAVSAPISSLRAPQVVDEKQPFPDVILQPGEVQLQLLPRTAPRVAGVFEVGDHVMGRFRNEGWYPGTLSTLHEDGQWTINYDDGDVERLPVERIKTMEEFAIAGLQANHSRNLARVEVSNTLKCSDKAVVTCSEAAAKTHGLHKIFDGLHGRPESDHTEWRVKMPSNRDPVKLSIALSQPYFVSRVRVFPFCFNKKLASSNFLLTVLPAVPRTSGAISTPRVVTDSVVHTEHIQTGECLEFAIQQAVTAVIFEFPFVEGKQWATLGGVDIYQVPSRMEHFEPECESTFKADFSYLLNNPQFSDCMLVLQDRRVHAHKNILAARSEFFRHMLAGPMTYKGAEEKVQEIHLPDSKSATFLSVLKYIYTDTVKLGSIDEALDLWCVADKYQLNYLKFQVEQYLSKELACDKAISACQMPSIELYDGLRNQLIGFLARHFEEAMDRPDFVRVPPSMLHSILCQVKVARTIEQMMPKPAEDSSKAPK